MAARLGRSSPWVTLVGVVFLLIGLAWDARLHRLNPQLATQEGVFSLRNPGHLLFGLGLGLIVVGTLFFLAGGVRRRSGRSVARRAASAAGAAGLLTLSGLAFAAAATGHGPDEGHTHAASGPDPASASEADRAAAARLLADTRAGAARFADFSVAAAEGYAEVRLIGLSLPPASPRHYHNQAYARDGKILDPQRPEDLVYVELPNGQQQLLGVMYLAPGGRAPAIGGALVTWHTHDNACFSLSGGVGFVNLLGQCPPGLIQPPVQPLMLHVWLFDNSDGPFASHLTRSSLAAAISQLRS